MSKLIEPPSTEDTVLNIGCRTCKIRRIKVSSLHVARSTPVDTGSATEGFQHAKDVSNLVEFVSGQVPQMKTFPSISKTNMPAAR